MPLVSSSASFPLGSTPLGTPVLDVGGAPSPKRTSLSEEEAGVFLAPPGVPCGHPDVQLEVSF